MYIGGLLENQHHLRATFIKYIKTKPVFQSQWLGIGRAREAINKRSYLENRLSIQLGLASEHLRYFVSNHTTHPEIGVGVVGIRVQYKWLIFNIFQLS